VLALGFHIAQPSSVYIVCQSAIPALSSTSVFVYRLVGSLSDTSYWSTIAGPTWTNPGYPLSSNFFLWESAVEIQWNERDISTLTVWDSAAGPSGAVVSPPDPSVYPFSDGPLQITRSFTDCPDPRSGCGAALGPGGAPGLSTKAISAIVGGALGGVILVLVVACCILRGRRRRPSRV
jgi:hypothetical protein